MAGSIENKEKVYISPEVLQLLLYSDISHDKYSLNK